MSASTFDRRPRATRDASARREHDAPTPRRSWIGVDLARFTTAPRSRTVLPLVVVALVAALGIAALRIDLIRTRYALAASLAEEQARIEEQRALIVRLRGLRDPSVLAALAGERGYRPAERVIAMTDPSPGPVKGTAPSGDAMPVSGRAFPTSDRHAANEMDALPPVASGPPDAAADSAASGAIAR